MCKILVLTDSVMHHEYLPMKPLMTLAMDWMPEDCDPKLAFWKDVPHSM